MVIQPWYETLEHMYLQSLILMHGVVSLHGNTTCVWME